MYLSLTLATQEWSQLADAVVVCPRPSGSAVTHTPTGRLEETVSSSSGELGVLPVEKQTAGLLRVKLST